MFRTFDQLDRRVEAWPRSCPIGEGVEAGPIGEKGRMGMWDEGKWLRYRLRSAGQGEFTVLLAKDDRYPEVDIICGMCIRLDEPNTGEGRSCSVM